MKQLTDEQIEEMARQEQLLLVCDDLEALTEIVRATERALAALDTEQPVPEVNAMLVSAVQFLLGASAPMTTQQKECWPGLEAALTTAKQAQPERATSDDPLQGAVDWFLQADGEFFCVATVQRTLRIGYNRAKRLCDIAKERAAIKQGGQQ